MVDGIRQSFPNEVTMKVEQIELSLVVRDYAEDVDSAVRSLEASIYIPRTEWEYVEWAAIVNVLAKQLTTAAQFCEE
jgi:hypothetical protein